MDFSASAATKEAARLRRRRFCTPRFFSTLPHRLDAPKVELRQFLPRSEVVVSPAPK
jgi:hypothetical protein